MRHVRERWVMADQGLQALATQLRAGSPEGLAHLDAEQLRELAEA
jgi:hypothetical protein